jgi:hypothetical protein
MACFILGIYFFASQAAGINSNHPRVQMPGPKPGCWWFSSYFFHFAYSLIKSLM